MMNLKTVILILVILVSLRYGLVAQDIHFSQYEAFAPNLNPALTGFLPIANNVRLGVIMRDQWSSFLGGEAYKTIGVSFDMRNCFFDDNNNSFSRARNKDNGPTWGLGLSYIRDEAGVQSVKDISSGTFPLVRDYFQLSSSVILKTSDALYVNLGFRARGTFSRLNTEHLRFDEQFDGIAGFDPNIIGEFDSFNQLNSQSLGLGGGFAVFYFGNSWGINGGMAIDRIFRPVYHNFTSDEPLELSRKVSANIKASSTLWNGKSNDIGINGKILFVRQSPYEQWIFGIDLFLQNGEYFTLAAGLSLRSTRTIDNSYHVDAVIAGLSLYLNKFILGISYDVNVSGLNVVSNSRGALEFSLIYQFKRTSKCSPAKVGCPKKGENKIHPLFI